MWFTLGMEISVIIEKADQVGNGGIVSEKRARKILANQPVTIRSINGKENHDDMHGNLFYVEVDEQTEAGANIMATLEKLGECDIEVAGCLVQFRNEDLY